MAEEEIVIVDRLNLGPRKCLDFRTPYEVFFGLTVLLLHLLLESKLLSWTLHLYIINFYICFCVGWIESDLSDRALP